jgi:hypothetical protein
MKEVGHVVCLPDTILLAAVDIQVMSQERIVSKMIGRPRFDYQDDYSLRHLRVQTNSGTNPLHTSALSPS